MSAPGLLERTFCIYELQLSVNKSLYIVFDGGNSAYAEFLLKYSENIGRKESRQSGTCMYILHTQRKECKQHDDSFLLIPCYIEHDWQVVDVLYTESIFQSIGYDDERI